MKLRQKGYQVFPIMYVEFKVTKSKSKVISGQQT